MLFKEFPNFDEALSWASHLKETGWGAVLIEDGRQNYHCSRQPTDTAHRGTQVNSDGLARGIGPISPVPSSTPTS
jgi:hypothetical protein